MGGGEDQDAAFQWMCERAGNGNFLVLRASGTDAYNPYVQKLCPALASVETLVIPSRDAALDPFVADKIRKASAVFLSGGDQSKYVNFWRGTPVENEINAAIRRSVPVGGTSAGLAVLAEYSFAALKDTVKSPEALANPYDEHVTITRDFLKVPHLEGTITDSHFVARDRLGRSIVFLARISADAWTRMPKGICIDEKTAVLMEADGSARVTGQGAVYFLRATDPPQRCVAGIPLTFKNVSVYKLTAGAGRFNIAKWEGSGGEQYQLSAENGVLKSTQPDNRIY